MQWLGKVPGHWKMMRGKSLFFESLIPVRTADEVVTCFRDGQVTLRRNRRTTGFMMALYESGYQGVRKGQLVIHAMDAFAGAIGVSESDGKCTHEYIVCLPRSVESLPRYYAYVLRFAAFQGFILVSCPAVRERAPRFRYPNFGDMQLPLPPREEQNAIVRFLDYANGRIERTIRAKRKLISLLNEQRQAIIHRAVTRGLDPDVKLKPSNSPWLGDVPKHWDYRMFGRLSSVVRGASPRPAGDRRYYFGSHIPWLTVGEVTKDAGIYLEKTETYLTKLGAEHSVRFSARTLVITNSGATLGVPKILSVDACANDGIVAFLRLDRLCLTVAISARTVGHDLLLPKYSLFTSGESPIQSNNITTN